MASYNRVILVGNLTRDIELKYTQGGTAVTDIGLAVNDRRKSSGGDWVEETTFVEFTMWGRTAEVASEYLSKGSPIMIEGRLKLDTWETDGQKRSKLRVICERMQMLSSGRPAGGGPQGGGHASEPRSNYESQPTSNYNQDQQAAPQHNSGPPAGGPPAGAPEAQPTGGGAGYDDPNIPF